MIDGAATRTFKTAWFAKAARKARIDDAELCLAIVQVRKGQADDLGGGVFKKRLDRNRDNISTEELAAFRDLADLYDRKTDDDIALEIEAKALTEICHVDKA